MSITSSTVLDSVFTASKDSAVFHDGNDASFFDNLIFHYNLRYYDNDNAVVVVGTTTAENDSRLIDIEDECCRPGKSTSAGELLPSFQLKRFVMQSVVGGGDSCTTAAAIVFRVHVPTTRPLLLDIFCNAVSADHYLTGQPIKFKSVCKFKVVIFVSQK